MDIFELLNVENGNKEEAKSKYQKLLIIYELGIIMNKNDEEICAIYTEKRNKLKEAGSKTFENSDKLILSPQDSEYIYSKIYSCLNIETIHHEQKEELKRLIKPMEDCGMKYFLLARLEMNDLDFTHYFNVEEANKIYTFLNKALELEPSNLLYLEYEKLFEKALNAYEIQEKERLEKANKELAERKRIAAQHVAQEEMRRMTGYCIGAMPFICFCFCCGGFCSNSCC
jgi:hypothetical protein